MLKGVGSVRKVCISSTLRQMICRRQYFSSSTGEEPRITRVLTNLCCETAAREAFVRDFDVFFAIDATAAYNEEMHLATLMNFAYGFATPVTTYSIVQALNVE